MHLEAVVITDYVDETLSASEREAADRHLASCAECRRVIDDFREIRKVAGSLDDRQPPARAWQRLERAIKLEREHADGGIVATDASKPTRGSVTQWLGFAAAAAVLVIATVASLRYVMRSQPSDLHGARVASSAPGAPATASDTARSQASAAAVEAELRAAEEHYDKAIKGLEQIASAEQGALDPGTAATLQKNLAVIDQAISESRAAVVAQPASEPARESLLESFRTKLALLQDTVALINEMRKGNEAGAARVVSGLKQKGN